MSALPTVLDAPAGAPRTAPAPRRPPARRPALALVPPPVRSTAPKAPFIALVLVLLGGGLVGLLLLNTVLAQDAFQLDHLQQRQTALATQEQALTRQIAYDNDPATLAMRAQRLGMQPVGTPRFLAPGEKVPAGATVAGGVVTVPSQAERAAAAKKAAAARGAAAKKAAAVEAAAARRAAAARQVATGGATGGVPPTAGAAAQAAGAGVAAAAGSAGPAR